MLPLSSLQSAKRVRAPEWAWITSICPPACEMKMASGREKMRVKPCLPCWRHELYTQIVLFSHFVHLLRAWFTRTRVPRYPVHGSAVRVKDSLV